MNRTFALAFALALLLASPCTALTTIVGGHHIFASPGEVTFPIVATSDAGETLMAVDVFLVMEPAGPIITEVNLTDGTVFDGNNQGVFGFGFPYATPGREPAYLTSTQFGTVPTGIVAFVTVDFTGVAPGTYNFSLYSEQFGPSAAFTADVHPGTYVNGTVTLVPEPSSSVLGLFFAATIGTVAIRRRSGR